MSIYDPVFYSRLLTETTLAFHIIFATIGVGVPVMIMLAELASIKRKDPYYALLARRWARGFVITVAIGVVRVLLSGFNSACCGRSSWRLLGKPLRFRYF
jgi:cytochrome d ubiquinol oxidase subunit I